MNQTRQFSFLEHREELVFDTVKNYQIYSPHNNITKIIQSINRSQQRKKKLRKIKSQIQGLKDDVEKLKLLSQNQLISSSSPVSGTGPKSKYWSFLFGEENQRGR